MGALRSWAIKEWFGFGLKQAGGGLEGREQRLPANVCEFSGNGCKLKGSHEGRVLVLHFFLFPLPSSSFFFLLFFSCLFFLFIFLLLRCLVSFSSLILLFLFIVFFLVFSCLFLLIFFVFFLRIFITSFC